MENDLTFRVVLNSADGPPKVIALFTSHRDSTFYAANTPHHPFELIEVEEFLGGKWVNIMDGD